MRSLGIKKKVNRLICSILVALSLLRACLKSCQMVEIVLFY